MDPRARHQSLTSGIVSFSLHPDALTNGPFCIDLLFYEEGAAEDLLECCHIEWCLDLPPCDENIFGCIGADGLELRSECHGGGRLLRVQ